MKIKFLYRLNDLIFKPRGTLLKYCINVTPILILPAVLISFSIALIAVFIPELTEAFPKSQKAEMATLIGYGIFTPIVETILLVLIIEFLSLFTLNIIRVSLISAVLWAFAHGLIAPFWAIPQVWVFFILSIAYMVWRRESYQHAFWAAAFLHIINNSIVVAFIFLID